MRNYVKFPLLMALILTLAGFISPVASSAENKTCWFKASGSYDVYFIIREKKEGMGDREYTMWKGWVKHYEKKHYVSATGEVRYDYKTSLDDKLIGDNHAECKNGKVIHVP